MPASDNELNAESILFLGSYNLYERKLFSHVYLVFHMICVILGLVLMYYSSYNFQLPVVVIPTLSIIISYFITKKKYRTREIIPWKTEIANFNPSLFSGFEYILSNNKFRNGEEKQFWNKVLCNELDSPFSFMSSKFEDVFLSSQSFFRNYLSITMAHVFDYFVAMMISVFPAFCVYLILIILTFIWYSAAMIGFLLAFSEGYYLISIIPFIAIFLTQSFVNYLIISNKYKHLIEEANKNRFYWMSLEVIRVNYEKTRKKFENFKSSISIGTFKEQRDLINNAETIYQDFFNLSYLKPLGRLYSYYDKIKFRDLHENFKYGGNLDIFSLVDEFTQILNHYRIFKDSDNHRIIDLIQTAEFLKSTIKEDLKIFTRTKTSSFIKNITKTYLRPEYYFRLYNLKDKFSTFLHKDGKKIDLLALENWVNQFKPEDREIAVRILENIEYFDRERSVNAFKHCFYNDLSEDVREKVIITNLGSPFDSSHLLTYILGDLMEKVRTDNLRSILESNESENLEILFVDDNIGSGKQLIKIFYDLLGLEYEELEGIHAQPLNELQKERLKRIPIHIFVLVGFKEGIENVLLNLREAGVNDVKIHSFKELEASIGCFHETSDIFRSNRERIRAIDIFQSIGCSLYSDKDWSQEKKNDRALGYGNSQKLIVFFYNVPTSTLPILWKEGIYEGNEWEPLFIRREKKMLDIKNNIENQEIKEISSNTFGKLESSLIDTIYEQIVRNPTLYHKESPNITSQRKISIKIRDKFVCQICNEKFEDNELEIDHMFPYGAGGSNADINLMALCRECNSNKSKRLNYYRSEEGRQKLKDNIKQFVIALPMIHDFGAWLKKSGDKRHSE